jgi:cleavage and polyadenylation specificity factor subunit 1
MSFTALRTVLPPTCVEHSVRAHMTSSAHVNLVVARASQLQLYRLLTPAEQSEQQQQDGAAASLVLVHERSLFGRIESLVAFRPPGWPRDLLAVMVRDAKLSILQFDITRHDFVVVSLHYFESSDIHEDDRLSVRPAAFRVDPTARCGVARAYDRKLLVVPFRGEFAPGDPLGPVDDYRPLPASYPLDLDKLAIRHVKDFCFLENYFQPALLLLHDVELTCPGRAAYRRNTVAVTVLTLDPALRLAERLWSVDGLPFDTMSVVPAPKAVGGALLLSLNAVVYVNEKVRIALPHSSAPTTAGCTHCVSFSRAAPSSRSHFVAWVA